LVKNYQAQQSSSEPAFAHEDPTLLNFECLEPTSGRKRWKMKHHKRIKKKEKPQKNGYQGS
jgi:hypothetical protein